MENDLDMLIILFYFYFDERTFLNIYLRIILWILLFFPINDDFHVFGNLIIREHVCEFF